MYSDVSQGTCTPIFLRILQCLSCYSDVFSLLVPGYFSGYYDDCRGTLIISSVFPYFAGASIFFRVLVLKYFSTYSDDCHDTPIISSVLRYLSPSRNALSGFSQIKAFPYDYGHTT